MIPKYARYHYCIQKATEFLLSEKIAFFPYDSDNIIFKHRWARLKYSQLAKKMQTNLSDIIEAFDSEDGYSIYNGNNYTIAYNDKQIPRRIYFTKLHEIGHIFLHHFIQFEETKLQRCKLNKSSYKVLENEANCFARNVIAPAVIVKELNLDTPKKVSNFFGITYQAAKTRLDLLDNDLKYINKYNEQQLFSLFNDFIYKRHCFKCNFSFVSKNAKYCPICGYNVLDRGDENMIYDGYALDNKGRALECPVCQNEQMAIDGVYCKVCGTYLINKCTNDEGVYEQTSFNSGIEIKPKCGMICDGNARFCEYCGEPTTFYKQGLFKNWKTNKTYNEIQYETEKQIASTTSNISDEDIPF